MNRDALLHRVDREEALSMAYALAVASAAGCTVFALRLLGVAARHA